MMLLEILGFFAMLVCLWLLVRHLIWRSRPESYWWGEDE